MSIHWDAYSSYLTVHGETKRDRAIYETQRSISKRATRSVACKTVLIDGVEQTVVITAGSELCYKKINALPNERIYAGSTVIWNHHPWLITDTDCEDEIYQRGTMSRCNVCLRWQREDGTITSRWGFSENLSLFNAGSVFAKVMDGIQQIYKVHLPVDSDTIKLRRDKRFLIDIVHDEPNAYVVTNRDVITYDTAIYEVDGNEEFSGKGKILTLTLSQTQLSQRDNTALMIADYRDTENSGEPVVGNVVIQHKGEATVKIGGSAKKFTAFFTDADGNVLSLQPSWNVIVPPEFEGIPIITELDGALSIKIPDAQAMLNSYIKIVVTDATKSYQSELIVKVVSIYG